MDGLPDIVPAAVIFDFNGTLSDDERLLCDVYAELFRERLGWSMSPADYYRRLAGRSDAEIIGQVVDELGRARAATDPAGAAALSGDPGRDLVRDLLAERGRLYAAHVERESPIRPSTIELVEGLAAAGVPMAIVTGAARDEVAFVLSHSPLAGVFAIRVTEEDVTRGKPDPEGYLMGAQELGVDPARCLVFEDSLPGVAAAHAAGMRCVAVEGTHSRAELEAVADAVVGRLGPELLPVALPTAR